MKKFRIYLSAFFLLVHFCSFSRVIKQQTAANTDTKTFGLQTYNTNSGLPSNSTTSTIKDKNGFLWVGTENGLCQFDGYSFKIFINIPGDSTSLTNNYITTIIVDKKGRIWVGTLGGLNLLDPVSQKFKRFTHQDKKHNSLSNDKIWSLLSDSDNDIWIGTDDGFDRFIEKTQCFEIFRPSPTNPGAIKGKSVNAIIEDNHGNLWLGNWGGGLNKFNKHTKQFVNFPQKQKPGDRNPNDVWSISLDNDGNIWVGTYWKGLFKFDVHTQKFLPFKSSDPANHAVFRILNLGNNTLLLAGNDGFFYFNSLSGRWNAAISLRSFQQAGLYQDNSGIIWVSTLDGLCKMDSKQYKFSFKPFSTTQRTIKGLIVKDNSVWLGTNNGLTMYNLKSNSSTTFLHSSDPNNVGSNDINKLYLDRTRKLWVLTEFGFDEFDDKTKTFIPHFHHSSLGNFFNEDVFRDILEVNPGEYWLATDAGLKIYHSKDNSFKHFYNKPDDPNSLNNNHLYCLLNDAEKKIWIGTQGGGADRFDQKTQKFYHFISGSNKGSISNNDIHNIYQDSHRNLWICTQDGLDKFLPVSNTFTVYAKQTGFASNVFKQMMEDHKGNLWVLTETGISCFNPQTMMVKNFDEGDGVLANAVMYKVSDNQFLIAGNRGLVFFNPLAIDYNTVIPPVYISDLQIFNKSVLPSADGILKKPIQNTDEITLSYDQRDFSLEFVALNFTHTEKNSYAYKLEGFEKKWNYVGKQRRAVYTNLNPGKYTFLLKASNNDGVWNNIGRALIIIISPPLYLTWYAYFAYFLFLSSAILGYIYYNNRQAKLKYEVRLAHMESEKEKELHEKKLSFFTNISHEFRTPLTLIINPLKEILYKGGYDIDLQSINTINRNAKRLLSLVDQLLLFRKADADADRLKLALIDITALSKEVFLCFSHQAGTKQLVYEFYSSDEPLELVADREKIEIVLFNLVANAIKFTDAGGQVSLGIEQTEDEVIIRVSDTGCGITKTAGNKLYQQYYQDHQFNKMFKGGLGIGLFLVKNYVDQHHGTIAYESEEHSGTVFTLKLLKGAEHFDPTIVLTKSPERSAFFEELLEERINSDKASDIKKADQPDLDILSELKSMLIIEDNHEIIEYIKTIFKDGYIIYEAGDGKSGLNMVLELMPDIVISDVMMPGMSGIELCTSIKNNPDIGHIPVILLTAITSPEIKLKGIMGGADDYISKPFEKEMLIARVNGMFKSRNKLQRYFFNEITLKTNHQKISQEYKDFLKKCLDIVERHINDSSFNIKILAAEMGMSHSNIYRKIKSMSGQSANGFIRFIRLRKAAEIMLTTDMTIAEVAYQVGFKDLKYFREQFSKLFGANPSDYIKKYRTSYHENTAINKRILKNIR